MSVTTKVFSAGASLVAQMAESGGLSPVRAAHPSPRLEPHAARSSSRRRCPGRGPCWVPIFLPGASRGQDGAASSGLLSLYSPPQGPAPHLPVAISGLVRCLPWADLPLGTPGASLGPHSSVELLGGDRAQFADPPVGEPRAPPSPARGPPSVLGARPSAGRSFQGPHRPGLAAQPAAAVGSAPTLLPQPCL